jgi:hypothetical protein
MNKFVLAVAVVLVVAVESVFSGGEGKINGSPVTLNAATNSIADLYTWKVICMSGESGNIVVQTKWPGFLLKGFLNPQDSVIHIRCRTQQLDTGRIPVSIRSYIWKIPVIDVVFKTGTAVDTFYGLFQHQ